MKPLTPEKLVQRFKDAVLAEQLPWAMHDFNYNNVEILSLEEIHKERARLEKEIVQRLSERD